MIIPPPLFLLLSRRKAANKLDEPDDVLPVPDNRRAPLKVNLQYIRAPPGFLACTFNIVLIYIGDYTQLSLE